MSVEFRKTGAAAGELSFHADRPPEQVFDYLADFGRHAEWTQEIVDQQQTSSGPMGAGATFKTTEAMRPGSRMKAPTSCEVTAFQRPQLIEWKARTAATTGPMAMRSHWAFDIGPDGEGSRVTQRFGFEPPNVFSKIFLRLFIPLADLMGGMGASPKNIRKHGENLEAILNSGRVL